MYQLQKILFLLLVLFAISGCGLKGDLYLPEAKPQVVDSTSQDLESTPMELSESQTPPINTAPESAQSE